MGKILIYDSGAQIYDAFKKDTEKRSIDIELISEPDDLINTIKPKKYKAIVINLEIKSSRNDISAKMLIQIVKRLDPVLPIIVTSDKSSLDIEKEIRSENIFFYMIKPFSSVEIHSILDEIMIKTQDIQ